MMRLYKIELRYPDGSHVEYAQHALDDGDARRKAQELVQHMHYGQPSAIIVKAYNVRTN